MGMFVSVASGKGGTGKTTLSLLLAAARSNVTLIDCDVEEPNCHLFLRPVWESHKQDISVMVPRIDAKRCNGCGACSEVCLFNAIAVAGDHAFLFDELCHSCGGCLLACPFGAITEDKKSVGTITCGVSALIPIFVSVAVYLLSGCRVVYRSLKRSKKKRYHSAEMLF